MNETLKLIFSNAFTLIQAAPDFVRLALLIIDGVRKGVDFVEFRIDMSKFRKAEEPSKHDKDTSQLEGVFNPKPNGGNDPARKP